MYEANGVTYELFSQQRRLTSADVEGVAAGAPDRRAKPDVTVLPGLSGALAGRGVRRSRRPGPAGRLRGLRRQRASGCGTASVRGCAAALTALRPTPAEPSPSPPGLPPTRRARARTTGCCARCCSAYKERGRHGLAAPLGGLLAEVVAAAVGPARPVLLVPVPSTARAARERHGDHLAPVGPARRAPAAARPAGRSRWHGRCGRCRGRTPPACAAAERAAAAAAGVSGYAGGAAGLRRAAPGARSWCSTTSSRPAPRWPR